MIIEIGDKPLKDLTSKNVMEIAIIEGHIPHLEYWNKPDLLDFDNKTFSDTIVIDYVSTRKSDGIESCKFTFFFNFKELQMHTTNNNNTRGINRVRIETLRYLINEGFDIPLYKKG